MSGTASIVPSEKGVGSARESFGRWLLPGAILALVIVTTIISPSFLAARNLQEMLLKAAPLGIVVIGQCLVILVRGLDLSVASVMATSAVMATLFGTTDSSTFTVVAAAVGMGVVVGLINGVLVTKRSVSPFLATLATMSVLQGIRFTITQGVPNGNLPPIFRRIGTGFMFGVPINLLLLLLLAAVFIFLTDRLPLGRKIYIVGNNPRAARLVGIGVDNVTIFCYVMCSILAALGGLTLVGYVGVVDNWVGKGYELDSIVAAVLGGVALQGGRGTILGGLGGAALLVMLANLVLQLGLPIQFQLVFKGAVVIAATALYVRRGERT
jgi:ribose/xylose/arabinose/galactoside ABC-type transport system permease subunit